MHSVDVVVTCLLAILYCLGPAMCVNKLPSVYIIIEWLDMETVIFQLRGMCR